MGVATEGESMERYSVKKYGNWLFAIYDSETKLYVRKPGKENDRFAYDEKGKSNILTFTNKSQAQDYINKNLNNVATESSKKEKSMVKRAAEVHVYNPWDVCEDVSEVDSYGTEVYKAVVSVLGQPTFISDDDEGECDIFVYDNIDLKTISKKAAELKKTSYVASVTLASPERVDEIREREGGIYDWSKAGYKGPVLEGEEDNPEGLKVRYLLTTVDGEEIADFNLGRLKAKAREMDPSVEPEIEIQYFEDDGNGGLGDFIKGKRIWPEEDSAYEEDLYGFEAIERGGLEQLQTALSSLLTKEGSISTLSRVYDSAEKNGFSTDCKDQITYIKNTTDLSDTQMVLDDLLDCLETLLDDVQIELLTDDLTADTLEEEGEPTLGEDEEYSEPDDWSSLDSEDLPDEVKEDMANEGGEENPEEE